MKIFTIPYLLAVTLHYATLSEAYVATVWSGEGCNVKIPSFPSMTIVGSALNSTTTGCIVPSVPFNLGGFSLIGCAIGGEASLFSDSACTDLLMKVNNVLCAAVPVSSFTISEC